MRAFHRIDTQTGKNDEPKLFFLSETYLYFCFGAFETHRRDQFHFTQNTIQQRVVGRKGVGYGAIGLSVGFEAHVVPPRKGFEHLCKGRVAERDHVVLPDRITHGVGAADDPPLARAAVVEQLFGGRQLETTAAAVVEHHAPLVERYGDDVIVDVPCGTVVYDADSGEFLTEVTEDGQTINLLRGGRGGLGNWHFRTSTNQAPRYAQPGEPAVERNIILELKLLADVGLVGFPNAGKSTLLSAVSAARPKIADYPFTTMEPQLGIVDYRGRGSFVMADIPGIIEGASEGRGLGLRFLRHIERNAVLLFMVPADADDIAAQYAVLSRELEQFNPQLVDKPRVLAVSKSDMLDDELMAEIAKTLPEGIPTVFISSVTGFGIDKLKDLLWKEINDERNMLAAPLPAHRPLDVRHRVAEEDNFIIENPAPEPDDTDYFDFPDDEGDWEYESRLDDEV